MKNMISRAALVAGALTLGMTASYAQTVYDSKSLQVQVAVASSCSIGAVTGISFDNISAGVATTENPKSTTVAITCNAGDWNLKPTTDGSSGVRALANGAASLNYKLCTDVSAPTYAGCNAFVAANPFTGTNNGSATIRAVLEGSVTPTLSGVYTDTVTIQLTN